MDQARIQKAVREILEAIGEDPQREGLRETPQRVARMCGEIFSGVGEDPISLLQAQTEIGKEEMVLIKDIPFYSICEHHLLPFAGKAHVAYIPTRGRIVGLSKVARLVEMVAKRPQLQERMTGEIADALVAALRPLGVLVIIEAEHLCLSMRGIKKPGALAVTSALRGVFQKNPSTRAEALTLIQREKT